MKKKLYRMWRQVTADKKKFGLLVTTLAVGLLLWGRLLLIEKVPRIATADPALSAQDLGEHTGTGTEGAGDGPMRLLAPLPEVRVDLSDRLSQDLFAFRHNHYRPLPAEDIGHNEVQPGQGVVDEKVRRRELEEMAKDLRLQSVIQGDVPMVVINGRVLRVGDTIEGFEVAGFGTRSARVTREDLTFTLTMWNDND